MAEYITDFERICKKILELSKLLFDNRVVGVYVCENNIRFDLGERH